MNFSKSIKKKVQEIAKMVLGPVVWLWGCFFCRQRVVSAIIINNKKEILLVKKRDREHWILPGGKRYPKETDERCLSRELEEELPIFPFYGMEYYKTFLGRAPQKKYFLVVVAYFVGFFPPGSINPGAEIEKTLWTDKPCLLKLSAVTKKIVLSLIRGGKLSK